MGRNCIGDVGGAALGTALASNNSLQKLVLSNNHVQRSAPSIFAALERNTELTHLSLRENRIQRAGGIALAKSLMSNATLAHLDIRRNINLGDEGVSALCQ